MSVEIKKESNNKCPSFHKKLNIKANSEEIIGVIFFTVASPLHLKLDTNNDDHHCYCIAIDILVKLSTEHERQVEDNNDSHSQLDRYLHMKMGCYISISMFKL